MKHPNPKIDQFLSHMASRKLPHIDLSLDRIRGLLNALGNPQKRLPPVVHVAGTNGKGSLLAYLTAIFEHAGYTVNRLTSPYLIRFNEEIYLGGKEISDQYLLELMRRIEPYADEYPVTYFEAGTAIAFLAFAEVRSDILLLETGLGGRLDATNVVDTPALTAITPVSMDHSEFLGNTIAKIAAEKAGIIKKNIPCVTGRQSDEADTVLEDAAIKMNARLHRYGHEWQVNERAGGFHFESFLRSVDFPLPNLAGRHQIDNAGTAIACIDYLSGFKISNNDIAAGITHAIWPARLQRLMEGRLVDLIPPGMELWLDGGHNPGAGEVLADWITRQKKPVHLVCGMLKSKDARQTFSRIADIVASLTAISIDGGLTCYTPDELAHIAKEAGISSGKAGSVSEAINAIVKKENNDSVILICGSLYLAGNILALNGANPEKNTSHA